jgi:16S rRNA G1207 methylase RsmC
MVEEILLVTVVLVVLTLMVVEVADEGAMAAVHQQGQQPTTTKPSVRFVARAATMHFSAGIALIRPTKQRALSSRQLRQLMAILLIPITTWIVVQPNMSQVIWRGSPIRSVILEEIKFK